jgi:hypothetical protein
MRNPYCCSMTSEMNGHYVVMWLGSNGVWEPAAESSNDAIMPDSQTVAEMVADLQKNWDCFGNSTVALFYVAADAIDDNGDFDTHKINLVADVLFENNDPDENDELQYNEPIFAAIQL